MAAKRLKVWSYTSLGRKNYRMLLEVGRLGDQVYFKYGKINQFRITIEEWRMLNQHVDKPEPPATSE